MFGFGIEKFEVYTLKLVSGLILLHINKKHGIARSNELRWGTPARSSAQYNTK